MSPKPEISSEGGKYCAPAKNDWELVGWFWVSWFNGSGKSPSALLLAGPLVETSSWGEKQIFLKWSLDRTVFFAAWSSMNFKGEVFDGWTCFTCSALVILFPSTSVVSKDEDILIATNWFPLTSSLIGDTSVEEFEFSLAAGNLIWIGHSTVCLCEGEELRLDESSRWLEVRRRLRGMRYGADGIST